MANQACPNCHHVNRGADLYCERCGATLERRPIVVRQDQALSIAGHTLPARQLKRIGASLAVSVAALLAEAGLIWLRRRVQAMEATPPATKRHQKTQAAPETAVIVPDEAAEDVPTVTVYSERVVEVHRWGRPVKRVIERMVWRREERY